MLQASCFCGGIHIQITGAHSGISQCHCSRCRKVSGVNSYAHIIVARESVCWISGRDLVQTYQSDSGASTAFCRRCGSPAPDPIPRGYRIPVGLLDGDPIIPITEHIFVNSRAAWDVIGDDAPQYPDDGPPRTDFESVTSSSNSHGTE